MKRILPLITAALAASIVLVSCGGGSGGTAPAGGVAAPGSSGSGGTGSAGSSGGSGATQLSASSGEITAFGSVFVNGREFSTLGAQIIDNDTGAAIADAAALDVGMSVDVKPLAATPLAASAPQAAEIRVHPLARGYVDAVDTLASRLTVMGQTVQLTGATNYVDRRACVSASSSPCAAIAGASDLVATSGANAPGSYVGVHGFLFSPSAGSANIVATLVAIEDAPGANPSAAAFKAEGTVLGTTANSLTLGGLTVDLSQARCRSASGTVACGSAFSVGQVVSVYSATAPTLPATRFVAGVAAAQSRLPVQTAGATVELQGRVSKLTASPSGFVLRGVTVDATALPAASLPGVGDDVRVVGTVSADGESVVASALTLLHAAISRTVDLEGDVTAVTAGAAANTYAVTLLGQSVTVNAATRLSDLSSRSALRSGPGAFNIGSFAATLAASSSKHVVVDAAADGSGQLVAVSLRLLPASSSAAVQGVVDASPAPVNGSSASQPTTFSVHGLAVSADPAAFASPRLGWRSRAGTVSVAAGDLVVARGSFAGGVLTVMPPAGTGWPSWNAFVVDFGTPQVRDPGPF